LKLQLALILTAIGLGGCAHGPASLLEQASGATSQMVCSGVFVSGLTADQAYELQVKPEPGMRTVNWALRYRVDAAKREVSTAIAGGFTSRSVFSEGRGCTLINDGQPPPPLRPANDEQAPLTEIGPIRAVVPGSPALSAAIDSAFAEPGVNGPRATRAIVIVHEGQIVGERYAESIKLDTPLDGHSLAKSIVNALLGVLVRQGRLDLHAPVTATEWTPSDRRNEITLEQLMRMDAGFDFDEGAGASTAGQMWFTQNDTARFAALQPIVSQPGRQWHYSSGSYALLSRVLKEKVGGPQQLRDFASHEVFGPLGMRNVTMEFDGNGNLMGAHAVYASPRDWVRFGLLYLNDGVVDGQRVLPEGWVNFSTTPTLGMGYGAGFWLNTINTPVPTWGFPWGLPGAPSDAYMGRGYLGQWLVVVPSEHLVIVRMGFSHSGAGEMTSVARLVRETVTALHDHPSSGILPR
jgi:CubicO group peptidase (beta-lactamase class C family)